MFGEDIHARKSGKSLQMDDEKLIKSLYLEILTSPSIGTGFNCTK